MSQLVSVVDKENIDNRLDVREGGTIEFRSASWRGQIAVIRERIDRAWSRDIRRLGER